MPTRRFLLAVLLGVACSMLATAADPTSLRAAVGSQPQLNVIAGVINKNTVLKNNNVAISSSNVATIQDDTLSIQEAEDNLPPGVFLTGDEEPIQEASETDKEQRGFGPGFRRTRFCFRRGFTTVCGWRYPQDFWVRRGRFIYGRGCPFNQSFGRYFYC